jgi:hypothetical protein
MLAWVCLYVPVKKRLWWSPTWLLSMSQGWDGIFHPIPLIIHNYPISIQLPQLYPIWSMSNHTVSRNITYTMYPCYSDLEGYSLGGLRLKTQHDTTAHTHTHADIQWFQKETTICIYFPMFQLGKDADWRIVLSCRAFKFQMDKWTDLNIT